MATTEKVFAPAVFSDARSGVIVSPFQFVLDGNDSLRIVAVNTVANARIVIQGRRVNEAGTIEVFAFSHTPAADRSVTTQVFPLGRGALLNLVVLVAGATPLIGQTFVILQLVRGLTGPLVMLGILLQGYVTSTQGLGWPGSPIQSSTQGEGYVRNVFGTQPAAGGSVFEAVPTGARWEILGLVVTLTTTAFASNRRGQLFYSNASASYAYSAQADTVPASSVYSLLWVPGVQHDLAAPSTAVVAAIPNPTILLAASNVIINATATDAADQFGVPALVVREWLEVA